jgi:hypothetical protein
MIIDGKGEPTDAMGKNDFDIDPQDPQHLLKQSYSQATRPAYSFPQEVDYFTLNVTLGPPLEMSEMMGKTLDSKPRIRFDSPLISSEDLAKLRNLQTRGFNVKTFYMTYNAVKGQNQMQEELEILKRVIKDEVLTGNVHAIVLSHDDKRPDRALMPSYYAAADILRDLHPHFISIIVETHELVTPHMFDLITSVGGARLVCPQLLEKYIQHNADPKIDLFEGAQAK